MPNLPPELDQQHRLSAPYQLKSGPSPHLKVPWGFELTFRHYHRFPLSPALVFAIGLGLRDASRLIILLRAVQHPLFRSLKFSRFEAFDFCRDEM